MWAEEDPKKGSGIMVSDFIDGRERLLLDFMENVCNIVETIYNSTHACFCVCCHKKYHDYSLQAKKILVKDGGKWRVRDAMWTGTPTSNGPSKGLRMILKD